MKKLAFFLLMTLCQVALSQNLIVTLQQDSIHCEITKVSPHFLYFNYLKDRKITKTLIARDQVAYYELDFFDRNLIDLEGKKDLPKGVSPQVPFQLSFGGGLTYRLAKAPPGLAPGLRTIIESGRKGVRVSADAHYFFNEMVGLGLLYEGGFFKSESYAQLRDENNQPVEVYLTTNVKIHYIGPSLLYRLYGKDEKNQFVTGVSVGYAGLSDYTTAGKGYLLATGGNLGLAYSLGYFAGINEKVALGLQLSYVYALLSELRLSNGVSVERVKLPPNSRESLAQLGGSLRLMIAL